MQFEATPLDGSYIVYPEVREDERGWFARTYCKKEFARIGHQKEWVQLNHSSSKDKGTLRGLHYQLKPYSEVKLVRCVFGKVFDVIVDLREGSESFLQWFAAEISEENRKMMYIPEGFAHGFQCLTDNCQLIYHHSEFYNPEAEAGLKFDDPRLNIKWPFPVTNISDRDLSHAYIDETFKGI